MGVDLVTVSSLFSPVTLLYIVIGTFAGIVVGALPGLTATMAVSLMISLTYGMSTANAMAILFALYLGGIYGGSRSAILLNVPGTPSSAATALEGFPLAKRGEGSKAGVVVTLFSAAGGLVGLAFLAFSTNAIARFALKFGSWEYFWLAMFGIIISGNIASNKAYKGFISGMIGLFVSCIGMDALHGAVRYTFGNEYLLSGISLVPAMIGLFGLTEVFCTIADPESHLIAGGEKKESLHNIMSEIKESAVMLKKKFKIFFLSSVIGTLIGALPGVGPDIASWVSYDTAKRSSKEKETFGKGNYDGLIASETANNAATSGVFIPLLTLGIPGDAVSAIILGAIQLHGFRPGPTFFLETPGFVYFVFFALLIVNIVMFIEGVALTPIIANVLKSNSGIIMSVVVVLTVVGSYAINVRLFDVRVMVIFGFLGYFMRKLDIPAAPMALGIILGNMADTNFRRAVLAGHYDLSLFLTRPISAVLWVALVIIICWPLVRKAREKRKAAKQAING